VSVEKTFKVRVEAVDMDDMLTASCQSLTFTQTTSNALSEAEIVFRIKSLYDGKQIYDVLPKETVKGKTVKFQIFDMDDQAMTRKHSHVYVDHRLNYNNRGEAYSLTLFTREQCKNDMKVAEKCRAHEYEKLSDMVESILGENGFSVKSVQKTTAIPEFKVLRQPYISDYDFIVNEVNARAQSEDGSSGFRLFTIDGVEAIWSVIGDDAEEKTVDDDMVVEVIPSRRAQWVAESGSAVHQVTGFDMDSKVPLLAKKGPDVSNSYGDMAIPEPYDKSESYTHSAFTSQDAIDSFALRCQYKEVYAAFPFVVVVRGSEGWDEVPYNLTVNVVHEQGGGSLRGYASTIKHIYRVGEYRVHITCLRDKGGSL